MADFRDHLVAGQNSRREEYPKLRSKYLEQGTKTIQE